MPTRGERLNEIGRIVAAVELTEELYHHANLYATLYSCIT